MKFSFKKGAKAQKGFTLVELSVVVLVAGLMLGAVVKGQSLVENARAQKLLNDIKNVEALIGAYENAKGRLPGDCNGDGLVNTYLNTGGTGATLLSTLVYGTTAADQTARGILYSNSGAATTVATPGTPGNEIHCSPVSGQVGEEANANIWINDLRAGNFIGANTVPRIFAKHIGEDMMYVGTWYDLATTESYNAITLANVPAAMAQRVMQNINGNDSTTDFGQIRVINTEALGTYRGSAFTGATSGSVVNLVYFYRNQPRTAS